MLWHNKELNFLRTSVRLVTNFRSVLGSFFWWTVVVCCYVDALAHRDRNGHGGLASVDYRECVPSLAPIEGGILNHVMACLQGRPQSEY